MEKSAPSDSESNPVLAQVNSQNIFFRDYVQRFEDVKSKTSPKVLENPKLYASLKVNLLSQLIREELLRQEAVHREIQATSEEIAQEMTRLRGDIPEEKWRELIKEKGVNSSGLEETLGKQIVQRKLEKMITDARAKPLTTKEIELLFQRYRSELKPVNQVRLSQIAVRSREDAESLRTKIETGSLSFEAAAKQFSLSPDAARGGDVGWISEGGTMPAFDLAFNLPVNKVSAVIPSSFGFHLLLVKGKRQNRNMTLEEFTASFASRLQSERAREAFNLWLEELESQATVAKNTLLLESL